jgi:Skp1 family, tetramerisation domain
MTTSESIVQLPEGKVKLVSQDGFEFVIDEEAARVSSTIRGMLDSQGKTFL